MLDETRPYADIYFLQIEWSWDHNNHEMATVTYERYEEMHFNSYQELMAAAEGKKLELMAKLRKVFEVLDGSVMGKGEMVRLYKLMEPYGDYFTFDHHQGDKPVEVKMRLKPICSFDAEGNFAPV